MAKGSSTLSHAREGYISAPGLQQEQQQQNQQPWPSYKPPRAPVGVRRHVHTPTSPTGTRGGAQETMFWGAQAPFLTGQSAVRTGVGSAGAGGVDRESRMQAEAKGQPLLAKYVAMVSQQKAESEAGGLSRSNSARPGSSMSNQRPPSRPQTASSYWSNYDLDEGALDKMVAEAEVCFYACRHKNVNCVPACVACV